MNVAPCCCQGIIVEADIDEMSQIPFHSPTATLLVMPAHIKEGGGFECHIEFESAMH